MWVWLFNNKRNHYANAIGFQNGTEPLLVINFNSSNQNYHHDFTEVRIQLF